MLGIKTWAEPVPGSFMSVFMNGQTQYMYFRCHYCLNKCHKHSNIWVTPLCLCETTACVFRVKLAHEFSLVFSDLLVDAVLLPDLFSED